MKSIRDNAAANIDAIVRVIAEHYYSDVSVDPEESFWKDFDRVEKFKTDSNARHPNAKTQFRLERRSVAA